MILCTANIVACGTMYDLKYNQIGDNGSVNIKATDGSIKNIVLPDSIPPVLAVYSSAKSSISDVDMSETH